MKPADQQLLFVILCFLLLFAGSWPLYQYIVDVDGVGYAAIADQYAAGHWKEAINGYWSPLHSWLVIPLLKLGIPTIAAFKSTNGLFAVIVLVLFRQLLKQQSVPVKLHLPALLTAVVMLLYYAWYELAADLLLVVLLLSYFLLTGSEDFLYNRKKNAAAGVLGALCYLAKAYAFPFFLLHFILLHLLLNRKSKEWSNLLTGLFAFFLICLPWIVLLYNKYGQWMTGTAGKLNMSWYLVPERNTSLIFFPPPHQHAASWWEDPWYTQEHFYTLFSSASLFFHQIRVVLYNTQEWLKILFQISFLAPGILLALTVRFLKQAQYKDAFALLLLLGLPCGYLLIHIEERFLWTTGFFLLVAGSLFLDVYLKNSGLSRKQVLVVWLLFFGSFLVVPVDQLKDSLGKQKEVYTLAQILSQQRVKGSFASNQHIEECMIVAYLNRLVYHTPAPGKGSAVDYAIAARDSGIQQFLFFYDSPLEKTAFLSHKTIQTSQKVKELQNGLILVQF